MVIRVKYAHVIETTNVIDYRETFRLLMDWSIVQYSNLPTLLGSVNELEDDRPQGNECEDGGPRVEFAPLVHFVVRAASFSVSQ